jgi:predicted enzyme related to lactoylglutathione lyase
MTVIKGVSKVVIDVADQNRARDFWTETMGFTLVLDTPYGEERWLEVRTPDAAINLVLRQMVADDQTRQRIPERLPTSNVFFYCDDLQATFQVLAARGVEFPQPPIELPFGWWSMFQDREGNRFALVPRDESSGSLSAKDHSESENGA